MRYGLRYGPWLRVFMRSGVLIMASLVFGSDSPPADMPRTATLTDAKGVVEILQDADSKPVTASIGDVIKDKRIVRTGKKSRAELEFKDASIARLGSNTMFTFDRETRIIKLDCGSLLIQVFNPNGRCNIVTPAVTAAITGTAVLVEAGETGDTDVHLLGTDVEEGVQITHHLTGKTMSLKPGQVASGAVRQSGRNSSFSVKSFDVKEMWEKHTLGQKMGNLRNMDELKHFKEAAALKKNQPSGREAEGKQGEKHPVDSPEKAKEGQTGSEKVSKTTKDETVRQGNPDKPPEGKKGSTGEPDGVRERTHPNPENTKGTDGQKSDQGGGKHFSGDHKPGHETVRPHSQTHHSGR